MYLGLDLGTSAIKAILIDETQRVVGSASCSLVVTRPHPGWSEQDPGDWLAATDAALTDLKRAHGAALAAVRGIGLSGQMHGATVLDAGDRPLRPAILWNDTRAHEEAAALDANPIFRSLTGNVVFPGFTAPKLAWMKTHEPELFAQARRILLPKDYLRLWLTGETVSEMSDAAGTSWLDVGQRRWSTDLLAATDLGMEHMPALVEGTSASGTLRPFLAEQYGISPGAIVAGGGGDNAASAIGMGVLAPDQAFVSLGTSGVLFVSNAAFSPDPDSAVHAFCHAVPDTWHQMGVILSATDTLNWFARLQNRSAEELVTALGPDLKAPGPTLCLPYLSGERTPHNDAAIRGSFVGLSHATDQAALTRAVLEGVAFALRDNLAALTHAGANPERLLAVGGGSNSDYWLKLLATVLGLPIDRPEEGDFGAAFGAARLGLIAATGADPHDIATPPATARTFAPDTRLAQAAHEQYQRFRAAYPALKGIPE